MSVKYVCTEKAPAAVGPYSQAVKTGNLVFISGQLPLDPKTGEMVGGEAAEQAARCMENILAVLNEERMDAANIVKVTIYLQDMDDFGSVNEVYSSFFKQNYPARVCIEVAGLPKKALVEIDAIAVS